MSLYDRVLLTEAKLSRASIRILDWLAGMKAPEDGYVMVEYPKTGNMPNRAGFGP
jgi:hypothetical protein